MTATEERLKAALAERAGTVAEDTLRPLVIPRRRRRRWPRLLAPVAAAVAVVAVLGAEIAVEQMTGTPKPASGSGHTAPVVKIGGSPQGMAYDAASGTIYVATARYERAHGRRPLFRAEPGTLAMVDAAACNASTTRGCAHVRYAPTGGRGATDVAVDQRTHTAYVLNGSSKSVAVINTATCNGATVRGCSRNPVLVRLPYLGGDLAINPRTGAVYVAEVTPGKTRQQTRVEMSVINGAACNAADTSGCGAPPATVSIGTEPDQFPRISVDSGTNTVYVNGAGLAVIDGRTCNGTDSRGCTRALATVHGIVAGYESIAVDAQAGTIYDPTGTYPTGSGVVAAINRNTCNALDTTGCAGHLAAIRGGPGAGEATADPASHTLYVTNKPNAVSMVNTATCNATSVRACSQFPASFQAGANPRQIAIAPVSHTVYVMNSQGGGTLSVINGATCNATDTRGCPSEPAARTPAVTPYTCDSTVAGYESGEPAGPPTRTSVQVASGRAGGQAWSVWAKKGVIDPYGIEQGGLVLNGRWYPLCHDSLSAGANADFDLIDAGAHGIVYGFIQHPSKVTIRLGNHSPRWTPQSVLLPGVTFFIFQLPRSACAYHGLAVNAWQGKHWGGYSNASYGACVPNQIVGLTVGRSTWGPQYGGQHW
jgi:hypothetical protein